MPYIPHSSVRVRFNHAAVASQGLWIDTYFDGKQEVQRDTYMPMNRGTIMMQAVSNVHFDPNISHQPFLLVPVIWLESSLRISPACLKPGPWILLVEQLGRGEIHPVRVVGLV